MGIPTPNHRPTRPFAGAGAGLLLSQFPLRPYRAKLLKAKEDLKPSASNGAFCILFVAVDKKYAAGGKQETTAGKSGPPEAVPYIKSSKEKIVLAFCRRGIYNSIKSIKG